MVQDQAWQLVQPLALKTLTAQQEIRLHVSLGHTLSLEVSLSRQSALNVLQAKSAQIFLLASKTAQLDSFVQVN